MNTIKKFIGEFQTEINSFINTHTNRQLLVAPTGTGKTTAIINYADSNPQKKIVLLCPFRVLVDNIKKKNPNLNCGYGAEFLNKNKTTRFVITTYDSIEKIEDVDLYVVDEAHLLSSHSSFRDVIPLILQTQTKVVYITATPEVIEDLFPKYNIQDYVLKFSIKRPKEEVRIYAQNYKAKQIITDIITNNKDNKKTVLIRVNSKSVIDSIIETFKPTLKEKIACFYSDEENVLYQSQDKDKVKELKKGKISNLDFILCTSVYDVGISFEVDRDIECYAVSQDNRYMPNPIDMVQLLARVREETGHKMNLTIIGNYQDYELENLELKNYKSKAQLCNEMAHRYENYTKLGWEQYQYVLSKYNIIVNEVQSLNLKPNKVKMASRLSDTYIAKNFHSFPKEYGIIVNNLKCKSESNQIKLITGNKIIKGAKNNANVQRVFNVLYEATKLGIDLNMFIDEDSYSAKKFNVLKDILNNYTTDSTDIFSNLIRGISYKEDSTFRYKELGYFELNKSKAKAIRTFYNMIYTRGDFRGKTIKKTKKKEVVYELVNFVNHITR